MSDRAPVPSAVMPTAATSPDGSGRTANASCQTVAAADACYPRELAGGARELHDAEIVPPGLGGVDRDQHIPRLVEGDGGGVQCGVDLATPE